MRVAVVDIGVDAVRLLVVEQRLPDLFSDGSLEWLDRRVTVTTTAPARNGAGFGRTIAILAGYAEAMRAWAVDRAVAVVADEVTESSGGERFVEQAAAALGVPPTPITRGEADALAFAGAVGGIEGPMPFLVVDVGPGGTRFSLGKHRPDFVASTPFGTRSVFGDEYPALPVDSGRLAMARTEARRHVRIDVPELPRTLVGAGPGFTSLAAVAMGSQSYDPSVVHGATLPLETVTALVSLLAEMDRTSTGSIPALDRLPGQALLGAAILIEQVMRYLGAAEAVVSVGDMLDGMIDEIISFRPGSSTMGMA